MKSGKIMTIICGNGEIRTLDKITPIPRFECGAFNHSATFPYRFFKNHLNEIPSYLKQ